MTLEEITASGNRIISSVEQYHKGFLTTIFGRHTINYWRLLPDGKWENYKCRSTYLPF